MTNIPFTGKEYLYKFTRKGFKTHTRYLTVAQLTKLSKFAGAINNKGERGLNRQTISERLNLGWTAWEAVHIPLGVKLRKHT